ncbi:MAG: hypothetical protein JWP89_6152 [Schlesneria sp.]|nr:hypothetical protein [Schlesneria sp.]
MWAFFRGWRRKVGCITLLVACLFLVMYLRSRVLLDEIAIVASTHQQECYGSMNGVFFWQSYEATLAVFTPTPYFSYGKLAFKPDGPFDPDNPGDAQWRSRWFGGGIVEFPTLPIRTVNGSGGAVSITLRYISYWYFIVPLTAVAAYLILCRPQKLEQ